VLESETRSIWAIKTGHVDIQTGELCGMQTRMGKQEKCERRGQNRRWAKMNGLESKRKLAGRERRQKAGDCDPTRLASTE